MSQISLKSGDSLTVDGDVVIQLDQARGGCAQLIVNEIDDIEVSHGKTAKTDEDVRDDLREIAAEAVTLVSKLDAESGQAFLSGFVADLYYAVAQNRQKAVYSQRQAEGIAAAKAKGVRFGRKARVLPDNFDEIRQAWRNKELSLNQAADACGMPVSSFYDAAIHRGGMKKSTV